MFYFERKTAEKIPTIIKGAINMSLSDKKYQRNSTAILNPQHTKVQIRVRNINVFMQAEMKIA